MKGPSQRLPLVSVVVISKDRHHDLINAVRSLLAVDYPKNGVEIIVVEEGDCPMPIAGVRYVHLPRRDLGLGYARNTGVQQATGEIIAFTDDDCLVDPNWITALVGCFQDEDVAGVAGATFAQGGSLIGLCEDVLGFPGGGHKRYHQYGGKEGETIHLSGCNCAYRRAVFDAHSFLEHGAGRLGADDYVLGKSVAEKHRCVYVPSAVVYHKPRGSLVRIISWFARRRINELLLEEKIDGRKSYLVFLRQAHRIALFRPVAVLVLVVFLGFAGLATAILLGIVWYVFTFLRSLPVVLAHFGMLRLALLVPVVKLCMDIGTALGEWRYLTKDSSSLGQTLKEYKR